MERSERYSGHESFVCRYGWLRKLYDAVKRNPKIFVEDAIEDAIAQLGIGRNMVKSLAFWGDAFGVIEGTPSEGLKPTEFGKRLLGEDGFDPYLEDVSSLWLLHWIVSTKANLGAWNTLFEDVRDVQFTRKRFEELLMKRARATRATISPKTVEDHARILFSTYIAGKFGEQEVLEDSLGSPLQELALLREVERDGERSIITFEYGPKLGLTAEVFAHALSDYWASVRCEDGTLPLKEIAYGTKGPGVVFRLDEDSVVGYLKDLGRITKSNFTFVDTPDIRTVNRKKAKVSWSLLGSQGRA